MVAEHDPRARLGGNLKGLGSNGDPSLRADAHRSAEAPDVWPPRTVRNGAEGRAVLLEGQVPGLPGRHFDFAVEFFGIVVLTQLIDVWIGGFEGFDLLGGEVGWQ